MSNSVMKKSALGLICLFPAMVPVLGHADGYPFSDSVRSDSVRGEARGQLSQEQPSGAKAAAASLAGERAEKERREAALAHYSRSRAMLLESLAEFERAREIARPDLLMNPEVFRSSIATRVEELERVIDPKPRVIESGVVLPAEPTLVRAEASGEKNALVHAKLSDVTKTRGVSSQPVKAKPTKKAPVAAKVNASLPKQELTEERPARARLLDSPRAETKQEIAKKADPLMPTEMEVQDERPSDRESDLKGSEEKSAVESAVTEKVAEAKAAPSRVEPLSEEELKARLKNIAADIEASDTAAPTSESVPSSLAVEPAAK